MIRFLLLLGCLLTTPVYAGNNTCSEHQCMAVVDAGSTGSRLHIFSYDLDETNTPIHISEIWVKKTNPGFATIEAKPNTINAYMTLLFAKAPVHNIPVYFYATAGMRLLPQAKQKIYYNTLKNWFLKQPWQLMEAKTIQGDHEALYDWLAVNYHLDTLKSPSNPAVGVMDIGGASVQIAFPIENSSSATKGSQVDLNLYGQDIHLFVHSFLGLGQNEMTHQLLDSTACFSDNYPLPNGTSGQGNASECAQEIGSLINGVHKTKIIVQALLAEHPISTWYAIGGISHLANSKPFEFQNNELTAQELLQQANNLICHQPWDDLSNQFPNDEYLDIYCLLPSFYYALMVDGYGLSPNQTVHYVPPTQELDWTLGVVLHHEGITS